MVTLLSERQNTDRESAASFHKDDSGLLQAAILWKTCNVWDSGVWKKDATKSTSLKYLRWLKVSLEYQWKLCLNCPPQSTWEVMNWSWLNTEVNWKWDGISLRTTSQQMEQFGSSHSECKYREQFQEWSAATETISDGFLRGMKSD